MKQPETVYDMNGIPIYPGDLLRTYHFTDARYRRKHYLYHVAVRSGRHGMQMVPVQVLERSKRGQGGRCCLTQACASHAEIISGYGPEPIWLDFRDRPVGVKPKHGSLSYEAVPQSPGLGGVQHSE